MDLLVDLPAVPLPPRFSMAARVILRRWKSDHITPLLRALQWLLFTQSKHQSPHLAYETLLVWLPTAPLATCPTSLPSHSGHISLLEYARHVQPQGLFIYCSLCLEWKVLLPVSMATPPSSHHSNVPFPGDPSMST